MPVVMQLCGSPWGRTGYEGQYLKDFDFEAHGGIGEILMTKDIAEAKRFADVGEAVVYRNTVPKCRPRRADGLPNRPMTSTHWNIFDPEQGE